MFLFFCGVSNEEKSMGRGKRQWCPDSQLGLNQDAWRFLVEMDFGEGALRRASVNCLRESLTLRRDYELVWIGGKDVKSARLNFVSDRNGCSIQLHCETVIWSENKAGSRVIQALWSAPITTHSTLERLLAVVLDDRLTVFSLNTPDNKAVKCKDILGKFVPRGCSWHPTQPVLALLSIRQAAVSRVTQDSDHVILPNISGSLVSCAWSSDGYQLAVSSSNHLCVYSWRDFGDLKNFTCQKSGSLDSSDGALLATVAMGPSTFLLTAEPLFGRMWSAWPADVFDASFNRDAAHEVTSDVSLNSTELVIPRTSASEHNKDSLLKFKLNSFSESAGSTKAQLLVVHSKDGKLEKLCSAVLDGLLSPDLLLFEPKSNAVVVGSNSCGELQVFSYSPATPARSASLTKVREIKLETNYKPKGLTLVPNMSGVLLVFLALPKTDPHPAFPPSGAFEEYYLKLQCLNLQMPCAQWQEEQAAGTVCDVTEVGPPGELESLRLPDGTVWQGVKEKSNLISEVEGRDDYPEEIVDSKMLLHEPKGQVVQHLRKIEEQLANFQTEVNRRLCVLEAKFDDLSEDGCLSSNRKLDHQYLTLDESEYVHVKWLDGIKQKCETFLLDKGRLKLETVQKTFGESLVQVCKDGHACIISAGEDGFIPIHFASGSIVCMTGKSSIKPFQPDDISLNSPNLP